VLSLVAGIEKSFGVKVDMRQLTEENFRSAATIAAMVERLLAESLLPGHENTPASHQRQVDPGMRHGGIGR
jgi:hypothetical protein